MVGTDMNWTKSLFPRRIREGRLVFSTSSNCSTGPSPLGRDRRFQLSQLLTMAGRTQITSSSSALIAMIADEDTVTGFLLAGVGDVDVRRKTNYLVVDSKTTVKTIEDAFKEFTTKDDIAIVLISQYIANMIRFLVDSYNKPVPAILEIPSKDHPYDPAHDSVLSRVRYLFSAESVAAGRR
ncbi:hypothetical protein HPP92_018775 [Vanilla planifolia]|uniref:V-type proton ATPase subunit F n=1 Tax=Vanilla planifolia TaxID=51239 RepID=A0A835Q6C0_VANPL|nr:hypothetical protein HPP92_018775 [Vanilla planifolia]